MKILIADQFSDLGGAQQALLELLPALQREGWTPVLALPGRGGLRAGAEALGIRCEEITCGPFGLGTKSISDVVKFGIQFPKLRAQLRGLVSEFRPDVLYVNAPRLVPAACSLGDAGPPVVFHLHSYLKPRYAAALAGRFLRRSRASIIANCQFVLEPLNGYVPDTAFSVVYNGVADYGFVQRRPEVRRIGMIGRISPEKGQILLVEAARLVTATPVSFVICGGTQFGDEASESYFRQVRERATGLAVEFLGWRDDIGEVLRSLDLLVVASMPQAEATTRVIPEAYSAGVPVLASDLPGIREVLKDGETGFLFPAGDAAALARRIREIVEAPAEKLNGVSAKARLEFEERFCLEVYQKQVMAIINKNLKTELPSPGLTLG